MVGIIFPPMKSSLALTSKLAFQPLSASSVAAAFPILAAAPVQVIVVVPFGFLTIVTFPTSSLSSVHVISVFKLSTLLTVPLFSAISLSAKAFTPASVNSNLASITSTMLVGCTV